MNRRQKLNVLSAAKSSERSKEKVLGKCPSALTGLRVEGRQDRGKGLKSDGRRNAFKKLDIVIFHSNTNTGVKISL